MTKKELGELLLSTRAAGCARNWLAALLGLGLTADLLRDQLRSGSPDVNWFSFGLKLVFLTGVFLAIAIPPRVRFHECGIRLPSVQDPSIHRLVGWDRISSYHWEGSALVLTGAAGSVVDGEPASGVIRFPEGRVPAVRAVLEKVLPAKEQPAACPTVQAGR